MSTIVYIGTKVIDSGYDEPSWSDPQSWVFIAKATPKVAAHTPSQGANVALYKIGCKASVVTAKTFFQPGSTSTPGAADRRVWVAVDMYVEILAGSYSTIDCTQFDIQLVRIS